MNYKTIVSQETEQRGLMATMFGDSRKKGLDRLHVVMM